jgi:nitrogenase molybdenum-iron protein alpha/beta subunit
MFEGKGSNAMTALCHRQEPDRLTGAILAIEGIRDAAVLLNGPTGCKFYHGAVAEGQLPRESSYDPLQFVDEFYFGQPRVPATYLDSEDYVFGASAKLERILPVVASKGHSLIAGGRGGEGLRIGDPEPRGESLPLTHKAELRIVHL